MKNLTYDKINITGGFWKEKQELIRNTTIWNVHKRFSDTGRFEAFNMNWKEGDPNKPHIFWDSDVAKWLESVAYLTMKKREPELEAIVDEVVDKIEKGRMDDGYFNIHYILFKKDERFTRRQDHELYCLGHLIEAAIAYDKATGKGKFLELMKDYVSLVRRIFMDEKREAFITPGHEEIELALVKLYDYTGDKSYLELAEFFVEKRGSDERGKDPERDMLGSPYLQAHKPIREQESAEGHAVRAVYLYCAVADLAERLGDESLKKTAQTLFDNIINEKMYITGAIGSTRRGEAFEESFLLPNDTAYAETCAALGLALFARRMGLLDRDSKYADTVERIIYNGFLSGLSLDGKAFFYVNSQEIDLENRKTQRADWKPITQRVEVFGCSCCPPNVTRFISSIGDFVYNYTDDIVYIDQYMESDADFGGFSIEQKTNYPFEGTVKIKLKGADKRIALRIPAWCGKYAITLNGKAADYKLEKGYAVVDARDGDELCLDLELTVRHMKADSRVRHIRGLSAVTYGPFVMCAEGVDNGERLGEVKLSGFDCRVAFDESLGLPTVIHPAIRQSGEGLYYDVESEKTERFDAKLIPYFAFANRGETDMRIWLELVK